MANELMPCPFCGEKVWDDDDGADFYMQEHPETHEDVKWRDVGCFDCGIFMSTYEGEEMWDGEEFVKADPVKMWNRRSTTHGTKEIKAR